MAIFKKRLTLLFAIVGVSLLSACRVDTHGHYHGGDTHRHVDSPRLNEFHVIDTYETNSEFDWGTDLAISPYVNAGQFEIFWDARSDQDYFVEFRLNDIPSTDGSRLISTELCGPYFYCHDHQYQFCDYTGGLNLECETSSGDYQVEYIGDMLYTIPQDLYMILQVCDTGFYYCEYETRRVSVE